MVLDCVDTSMGVFEISTLIGTIVKKPRAYGDQNDYLAVKYMQKLDWTCDRHGKLTFFTVSISAFLCLQLRLNLHIN